jgi:ribonuclease HI
VTAAARASRAIFRRSSTVRSVVKLVVHVDGGSRGNPGPAAAASVVSAPAGEVLDEASELLGTVTNNVAEYRALLLGLARARALGATEVEVVNDSELIAKQVRGLYKVKHASMRPLREEAMTALRGFHAWKIRTVPRAQNAHADALVNAALDDARATAAG